jgi:hypothetical protein
MLNHQLDTIMPSHHSHLSHPSLGPLVYDRRDLTAASGRLQAHSPSLSQYRHTHNYTCPWVTGALNPSSLARVCRKECRNVSGSLGASLPHGFCLAFFPAAFIIPPWFWVAVSRSHQQQDRPLPQRPAPCPKKKGNKLKK